MAWSLICGFDLHCAWGTFKMFMTKEEAANCKEAAMPVESEAEYLVWFKVTRNHIPTC